MDKMEKTEKEKLIGLVDMVKDFIDKGARSVEEIHKAILDQPLEIIEKFGPLEGPAKKAKAIQDRTIGSVYEIIHKINDEVGKVAKDLLEKMEKTPKAT